MFRSDKSKKIAILTTALSLILALAPTPRIGAADHGDGPGVGIDRSADINDVYMFLDPNDNTRVVMLLTVCGFIVSGEAVNFGVFDHRMRYRFEIESNGNTSPDGIIDVSFSEKVTSGATPQTATIKSTFFPSFTAQATNPTLNTIAPQPVVTTDQNTGITFFAGLVDDPFFFDIPAFVRFVNSALAGQPNPGFFNRARDSFSGYNTLSIGLSIPLSLLRSSLRVKNDSIGLLCRTQRRVNSVLQGRFPHHDFDDDDSEEGRRSNHAPPISARNFSTIDRMGNPAINVALIPFPRKNEYNLASPQDDADGVFAGDIIGTLRALGTNATNIGILAQVAVVRGDYLRLNLKQSNSGPGGGNNTGAGFPNGRRLADDTIDTILFFVANQNPLGDNVNANDVPLSNLFPFFAPSQQPRESGVDDNTRN
jgi:hypothetical protein